MRSLLPLLSLSLCLLAAACESCAVEPVGDDAGRNNLPVVGEGEGEGEGEDAGAPDAGLPDAGLPDAGLPDAGPSDAGLPDAGPPDAGAPNLPEAVAGLLSVNGAAPGSGPYAPFDDVQLTGADSEPSSAATQVSAWRWTILEAPSGVVLSDPDDVQTGFVMADGQHPGAGPAGYYEVGLEVDDDQSLTSTNDARVSFHIAPEGQLLVELLWTSPTANLDLHLRGDGVGYCHKETCAPANCYVGALAFLRPEWDGVPGRTAGDPVMIAVDNGGYGPEAITVQAPVDGTHRVGVLVLTGSTASATARVWAGGELVHEVTSGALVKDDMWEVADLVIAGGQITVSPVQTVTEDWNCSVDSQ